MKIKLNGNKNQFKIYINTYYPGDFWDGLAVKESTCNAGETGDAGSIPGLGRFPGEGNGNHFSILAENSHRKRHLTGHAQSNRLQRVGHDWMTKHKHMLFLRGLFKI